MKRLLDEAKRMIRINSETSRGNEELANYALNLMQERGLKSQLQQVTHSLEDVSKRQFNVIGILGDPLVDRKIRKGLLLNTHLDTVGPGLPENWTETGGDPFAATIKDGKIHGLGSADVKLDFLCKLHAVAKYREAKLKMPIYLVGTCGEEMGMFGARYLIKSMALNPKYVVVGEPSALGVVYAHKCMTIYRLTIGYQQVERDARGFNRRVDLHSFGRSSHGSFPQYGNNAAQAALDFLKLAVDKGFEFRFTRFDGGDTVNKVPDKAMVQMYLTSHQFEDFKRFFRESSKSLGDGRSFRVELGGIGDTGVRFLPDALFPCLQDMTDFFKLMSADFEKVGDTTFEPPFSTVNFGRLKQGIGGITMHFDLRLLPDLVPEQIDNHIQKGVQAIAAKYPSLNISVVRERMNPSLNMTLDHELVKIGHEALERAGLEPILRKKSASTEAAQYFQAGYQAIVFGPGLSAGNSHGPNEHNLLEHLEKATHYYEKLIEMVCT
ncbi:MAG: M20/M25/M40 family metallo-hydrolase [Oligoflexia bacterium]|nr:M20/M25/M40 family metallo-hydrolase [Oligoflexia bacterium]